jgi:Ycf66 protein N-terminus
MLAYVLALVVGLGSLTLYLAAFFFPEVHRKHDFILSGIGMFYALVLWVCAGRITGGLLLGQMAGVLLLGGLGWETLNLRRGLAPTDQQTALPSAAAMQAAWSNLTKPETLSGLPAQVLGGVTTFVGRLQAAIAAGAQAKQAASAPAETYVPLKREDFAAATKAVQSAADDVLEAAADPAKTLGQTLEETLAAAVKAVPSAEPMAPVRMPPPAVTRPAAAAPRPAARPAFSQPQPASSGPDLPSKVMGMVAAIAAAIPTAVQKLTKKKESQPIYVRKQFRPDDANDSAELAEPAAVTAVVGTVEVAGIVSAVAIAAVDVVESVDEPAVESAIAAPSADPVGTLTDVDLADLAQDLFQTVHPDAEPSVEVPMPPESLPESLTVESASTESLFVEAETAAMDLYDLADEARTDADVLDEMKLDEMKAAARSLFTHVQEPDEEADEAAVSADAEAKETSEAAGETLEPADEFADRWSGSQIPESDAPELPIDPPFLDE